MYNLADLVNRMDKFVLEVVNNQNIPYETKKNMGKDLLAQAEAICPSLPRDVANSLKVGIEHVRKTLNRWGITEISSVEEQLEAAVKYLGFLKKTAGPYPSAAQQAEIDRVAEQIRVFRTRLPRGSYEHGVERAGPRVPPELRAARTFRENMTQSVFTDENSLRTAIAQTQEEIRKLQLYRSRLDANADAILGRQAFDEIRELSALVGEWNNQLGYAHREDTLVRTWNWQMDSDREKTRSYVDHKQSEIARGMQNIAAAKMLREASNELERAFSLCQIVMEKAKIIMAPDIIPLNQIDASIGKFEGILNGLGTRLTEAEIREATRFLNRVKAYRSEMAKNIATLGYSSGLRADVTTKESEGLRYFQSNLPSVVREILSTRTINELERLASSGVAGAKEAIEQAIIMAGKQNPDRMRAYMGR